MSPRTSELAARVVLMLALGCGGPAEGPDWPEGALLAARTESLSRLFEHLSRLEQTPLARRAGALRDALPGCDVVESRAATGGLAEALEGLACAPQTSSLARLHELRGERDLAFALPLAEGGRLLGTLAISASGDVDLELSLPIGALRDARRLLVPGAAPPGPGILAAADSVVHARVRPEGGLALASLVSEGDQAERLFRLKSELFAGAVLDGTWEMAIYVPPEGGAMPHAALALGFAHRAAAVAAMEGFLREIQQTWPVHRSFFAVDGAEGACLLDLGLLPELAPCYVAGERALVVGWNPASVRRALAAGSARGPDAGIVVDLARLADADARLAAASPWVEGAPRVWPWRRLRADGEREADLVRVRVVLEGAA